MWESSIKRWSKPLGLACATFLSSWPGVFRQLRCLHIDSLSTSACIYASKRFKAFCASYTRRACAECFVLVSAKTQVSSSHMRERTILPSKFMFKPTGLRIKLKFIFTKDPMFDLYDSKIQFNLCFSRFCPQIFSDHLRQKFARTLQ